MCTRAVGVPTLTDSTTPSPANGSLGVKTAAAAAGQRESPGTSLGKPEPRCAGRLLPGKVKAEGSQWDEQGCGMS